MRLANIPVRDYRFWIIQLLIILIIVTHLRLEEARVLGGDWALYLLSISVLLIPVVYSALAFGLAGAIPTALWALVLSLPEISSHDWTIRIGILIQFGIVIAIGIIVGIRVDREAAATRAADQANLRLSRLNATAAAVAASLDLEHVLRGTLRATLNSRKTPSRLDSNARHAPYVGADDHRCQPGRAACCNSINSKRRSPSLPVLPGSSSATNPRDTDAHTVVVALKSGERTFGAIGLTQTEDTHPA